MTKYPTPDPDDLRGAQIIVHLRQLRAEPQVGSLVALGTYKGAFVQWRDDLLLLRDQDGSLVIIPNDNIAAVEAWKEQEARP